MRHIILCTPEYLPAYNDGSKTLAFGLNLSAAIEDGDKPHDPKLLKPWKWPEIIELLVCVMKKDNNGKLTPVKTLTVNGPSLKRLGSWMGESGQAFEQKRQQISKQLGDGLDNEYTLCESQAKTPCPNNPFCWEMGKSSQLTKEVRHWHTIVGQVSTLPPPFPQCLNLSFFFTINRSDVPSGTFVFAAPVLPANLFPNRLEPKATPQTSAKLKDREDIREWVYPDVVSADSGGTPVTVRMVAYVSQSEVNYPAPSTSISLLDLNTLWIGKLAGAPDTFDEDWRARLEDSLAGAFDLPNRIISYLREDLDDLRDKIREKEGQLRAEKDNAKIEKLKQELDALRQGLARRADDIARQIPQCVEMTIAGLRDVAGAGVGAKPGGRSLVENLRKKAFDKDEIDKIKQTVQSQLGTTEKWEKLLAALPGASGLKILNNQVALLEVSSAVAELEQLQRLVLDATTLQTLVEAQWRELHSTGIVFPSLSEAAKRIALNLPRQLALENLGYLWNFFLAEMSKQNSGTDPSGQTFIKENFPRFLLAYFCKRFSVVPSQLTDPQMASIKAEVEKVWPALTSYEARFPELRNSDGTLKNIDGTLRDALLKSIKKWGDNFASTLLPAQSLTGQETAVPHALSFQVDRLDSYQDDQEGKLRDLLNRISGVGMLMREPGKEWRCLNMASAAIRDHVEKTLALVPSRLSYQNDLRQAFVSYNNHPLGSKSPVAEMSIPLAHRSREDGNPLLIEYTYPVAPAGDQAILGKLTPLKFGSNYEVLPFIVSNCGALPRELAQGLDSPWEINLKDFNETWKDPTRWEGVRKKVRDGITYKRKVRIGQIRVFDYLNDKIDEKSDKRPKDSRLIPPLDLKTPAIPENVSPRAREMELITPGPQANEHHNHPLILLSELAWESSGGRPSFTFYMRMPATDLNTWDRWRANDPGADTSEVVRLRKGVWADFFKKSELNRQLIQASPERGKEPMNDVSIDDPALAPVYLIRLYSCDGLKTEQVGTDQWVEVPKDLWPNPNKDSLDAVQRDKVKVVCTHESTASISVDQSGTVQVSAGKGEVYCLVVNACLPIEQVQRFHEALYSLPTRSEKPPETKKEGAKPGNKLSASEKPPDTGKEVKKHPKTGKEYLLVSPFHLIIEAATGDLIKGLDLSRGETEVTKNELWKALTPSFKDGAINVSLTGGTEGFHYIQRVELLRQVWHWQGRETAPHPEIFGEETVFWERTGGHPPRTDKAQSQLDWETMEFGSRPDTDFLAVNMEVSPHEPTQQGGRRFHYRESLEFPKPPGGNSNFAGDELRALHYRFSARVHSRYEGIMPTGKANVFPSLVVKSQKGASQIETIWKPQFVPCRKRGFIPPPKVKFVLPLTETDEDGAQRTPGLIAVCHGAWHEVGGLGEWLRAEIELVDNEDKTKKYYEFGPDPLIEAPEDGFTPAEKKICLATQNIRGPVGHTFDRTDVAPLFTSTSFIIPAPSGAELQGKDLSWYFCKVRFQRVITLSGGKRFSGGCEADTTSQLLQSEFTQPYWVQFLPPFSIFANTRRARDLRLQIIEAKDENNESIVGGLKIIDRQGGEEISPASLTQKVGFVELDTYLAVTRKVFDVIGKPDQEAFVGVFYPKDPKDPNEMTWLAMGSSSPVKIRPDELLRARIIEVQRHTSRGPFNNQDELWKALFQVNEKPAPDPGAVMDHDRARIVRISEPIDIDVEGAG